MLVEVGLVQIIIDKILKVLVEQVEVGLAEVMETVIIIRLLLQEPLEPQTRVEVVEVEII
jgi:hypothetical protein